MRTAIGHGLVGPEAQGNSDKGRDGVKARPWPRRKAPAPCRKGIGSISPNRAADTAREGGRGDANEPQDVGKSDRSHVVL